MFAWAYVVRMATFSPGAVVRYFSSDSSALPEYFLEGSDDELSMQDSESNVEPDTDEKVPLIGAQDDSMDVDEGIYNTK